MPLKNNYTSNLELSLTCSILVACLCSLWLHLKLTIVLTLPIWKGSSHLLSLTEILPILWLHLLTKILVLPILWLHLLTKILVLPILRLHLLTIILVLSVLWLLHLLTLIMVLSLRIHLRISLSSILNLIVWLNWIIRWEASAHSFSYL